MRIILVAAASLALSYTASAASATDLRIALRDDPDVLDPTLATTYTGRIVFAGMCDKLFDIDQHMAIVPQLATGYEWSDSQTLLIHLRHGVKFQDGTTMDTSAVKESLERHLTMEGSFRRPEINQIDHIEVVDPLTVRMALKSPSAPFIAQLTDRAGMILAPEAAKEGKAFGTHPVCSGPYRFVERVPQDHITLERFPDYWNAGTIHFDRVIYLTMPDSSVQACQSTGRRHRHCRVHRADRREDGGVRSQAEARHIRRSWLPWDNQQSCQWSAGKYALWQGPQGAQGIRTGDRSQCTDQCGVQRSVSRIGSGNSANLAIP